MKNARKIILTATVALPALSVGQSSLPLNGASETPKPTTPRFELGGTPVIDLVKLTLGSGAPLRFGNVISGSEWVSLNGNKLRAGTDYTIDNAMGVIYLQIPYRDGDSLSVQYRHDPKAKAAASGSGPAAMKFSAGSGLTMQFGMGMTERTVDGKIFRTNMFGTKNAFSMGGGTSLTGAYFAGSRQKEQVGGAMTFDANAKGGQLQANDRDTSLLVQSFKMGMGGGGSFFADVQDISKDFSGFGQVKDAGYKDDQINAFTRERGLKRQSIGVSNMNVAGMKFSATDKSVSNGKESIDSSSYAIGTKSLGYSRSTEKIERGFNRFNDLGVANAQQLAQSQGMQRSVEDANFMTSLGQFKFNRTNLEDFEKKKGLEQTRLTFDGKQFGFDYKTQAVDQGFSRFEADRNIFGLEAGLNRTSFNITKAQFIPGLDFGFGQSSLNSQDAGFRTRDANIGTKTWSLETSLRASDAKFNRLWSMRPEEMDANTAAIAKMYGPGVVANPNDRPSFMQSAGLSRNANNFQSKIGKDGSVSASSMRIEGASDAATLDKFQVTGKNGQLTVRNMNVGEQFSELNRLMQFEQRQFGVIGNLRRSDTNLDLNLGKGSTLNLNFLNADRAGETLDRSKLAYRSAGLEIDVNERKVSNGFGVANMLEDAEKDMLGAFNGFAQRETRVKYDRTKNVQFEYLQSNANNRISTEQRNNTLLNMNWLVDSATNVGYFRQDSLNRNSLDTIFAASLERFSVQRQLSQGTNLQVINEQQVFDGINSGSPDSNRTTVALQTQLTKNTSLRTEQTKTSFSDGNKEEIQSNTVSTQIAKNVGVSMTNTNINREGADRDEVKRDYGFWWDFGKGVRMTYGYVRHLNGQSAGIGSSGFAFGQGVNRINPDQAIGGIQSANVNGTQFGFANGTNTWDDQLGRTQAFSSFALQTTKPFRMAFLENMKVNAVTSMASDNTVWLREDVATSMEGSIGKYGLGFQYKGQVNQQGQRAADRTYRFKTDFTNKSPFAVSFVHKQRVLPNGTEFTIRDYKLDWKLSKGFQISNQIQTNPEGPFNPNIILGTQPLAQRRNIWRLDYTGNKNFLIGGQFDEMRDDNIESIRRTAGFNMTLFQPSGSPLNLFYGIEQNSSLAGTNSYVRYGLSFDQRPGPNQLFSFSVGNQGWLQNVNSQLRGQNDWVARLNYQWRFK
jgi:hypothetical protein